MNYTYTVSSTKNNLFSNRFIINTDHKLTETEILNLKGNSKLFKDLVQKQNPAEKQILTLNWKDLDIEILPQDKIQLDPSISVSEIAIGNMKKLRSPALVTRLENLLDSWPSRIPIINLIWKLILGPLIFIGRFLNKNRGKVLHSLEDLNTSFDYNHPEEYLKDYKNNLQSFMKRLENNQGDKVADLKDYLLDMNRQANLIERSLKKNEKAFYTLCRNLSKEARKKLRQAEPEKETALMTLPVGFYQKNGKYQPLIATFYLEADKKLRLDLTSLGNSSLEHLQQSYRFNNPSSTLLADLTHHLCILSYSHKQGKPVTLSYREKIRTKVMHQFNKEEGELSHQNIQNFKQFNAAQWLNENLCILGGTPLKTIGAEENLDKTLNGIIGHDLTHFFPEVHLHDKLEFLIKLIEEHYDRFIAANPYLTKAQQMRQLELLKFKAKKLEAHLTKRMDPNNFAELRQVNKTFDSFFKKMDQLEKARLNVQKAGRLNKASEIDKAMIKKAGKFSLKANQAVTKPLQGQHATKKDNLIGPYQLDLDQLAKAVEESDYANMQRLLNKIQDEANRLIDKKEYSLAKQLSIQALQYLPIPEGNGQVFWENVKEKPVSQIVALNKHIWECSLRLQDNAPAKNQLLQMIKSQLIVSFLDNKALDKTELLDIIKLHPHYRFGWLPSQMTEVDQILSFLGQYKKPSARHDLEASTKEKRFDGNKGMGILQCTLSCLMKPDFTLFPFYAKGVVNEAQGVNYLDSLVKKAVNKGAKTAKEKSDMIKAFKYEDIQDRLKSMGRLELEPATYVTDKPCIKIFDRFSALKGSLAYVPNNIWLGRHEDYSAKYHFPNNQANTHALVGAIRGEETYLTANDDLEIHKTIPPKPEDFYMKKEVGTLSPQKGMTEPTLLQKNLTNDPQGQINQVSNYVLESLKVALHNDISISSSYEILNLIRTHSYLLSEPEFQKTIFLNITRPELLEKAIQTNPLYFEIFADDLQKLMQEQYGAKGVVPYLMLLADTIKEHTEYLNKKQPNENLQNLVKKFPGYDAEITFGDKIHTGYRWLHEWMIDPEKDRASIALSYMYASYKRPLDGQLSASEIALLIHAATIFKNSGDSIGIPLFNEEINQWVQKSLIPHLHKLCDEKAEFASNLANNWIRLCTGNPGYASKNWNKNGNYIYENEDFKIDLNSLNVTSKKPQYHFDGFVVDLPAPIARSITKYFGLDPIRATLRPGRSIYENYYDFQYKNESYSILYNQLNGKTTINRQLPIDLRNPSGKKEWFELVPQDSIPAENLSSIEVLIQKNGLWINTENPKQSYLFVHSPHQGDNEKPYLVTLKIDCTIDNISDPIRSLNVIINKNHRYTEAIPFTNPNETIFLASSTNNFVKEIRFLNDESRLERKSRGNWLYHNERQGDGYRWLTNLSDEQLFLKERSSAKAFLDSLGGMQEKFVLPLTNGKSHVFIIHPYKIQAHKGLAKIDFEQDISMIKDQPPLTITFDENGKMESNSAAFLYLAYYFSHMKNYRMAEHYLSKAKDAAGSSETDRVILERMEELFEQISLQSIRSVAFQLKAHLTIKHIRTTQLNKAVFEPNESGEFLDNLQHIAKLYSLYEKRHEELKEGGLTAEEQYEIDRYVKMSMQNYVNKYQEMEGVKTETLDVKFSEFEYFKKEDNFQKVNILKLLLMSRLVEKPSINKLVERKIPDPDYILHNFFNFMIAAVGCKTPNEEGLSEEEDKKRTKIKRMNLKKMQLFIAAPKSWELTSPKNPEEANNIQMAKFACSYLQVFLHSPFAGDFDPKELYDVLSKSKARLPYFDRNFGVLSTIYDIQLHTLDTVAHIAKELKEELMKAILGHEMAFQDKEGNYDPRKNGKYISSLRAVLKVLEEDKPPFLTPLEASKIPQMIREGDYDLDQPRELVTLLRDSEARNFSALEMRVDAQTLDLINKLEKEIRERPIENLEIGADYNLQLISQNFDEIRNALPSPISTDLEQVQKAKDALEAKAEELKKYFNNDVKNKKTHIEENTQLSEGIEIAKKKIEEEVQRKKTFTKKEIIELRKSIDLQLKTLKNTDAKERLELLENIRKMDVQEVQLKKIISHPEIYTEYDLFNEIIRVYKDPNRAKTLGDLQTSITSYLFKYTAFLQFKKAKELLDAHPSQTQAAHVLQMIHSAINEKRFQEAKIDNFVVRICLAAEARDGFIHRPAQLEALQKIKENPNRWYSLIMGLGKTSRIMPAVADILAKQGKFVVLTVPEIILKGNRQSLDKSSRALFDQAGLEFSLPLDETLSFGYLAEKYSKLLQVISEKGYVITSVEELCSLHNLIIQLEDEKCKILKNPNEESPKKLFHIEKKLHYLRKMSQLLHDEANELNLERILFGDEVDTTADSTHEVNLAAGKVVPPNKVVRESVRAILDLILTSKKQSPLHGLKKALLEDAQSILKNEGLEPYMHECAKAIKQDPTFSKFLGPDLSKIVSELNDEEWASYMTGKSNKRPEALGDWDKADNGKMYIAAAKQLLTQTLPSMLSLKSGNDFGFSDYQGFIAVPKVTKNETPGMRYGDEFELIAAQYLAYLELVPCKSLTDSSETFLKQALKTYQNKYPAKYELLIADFAAYQQKAKKAQISLLDYLKMPKSWRHRLNILDEIVFEGGYISRFNKQITTNVQEMYHGNKGGMTGTLDPYILPFISHEVQFHKAENDEKVSTREVEAETLLRLILNLADGIHTKVQVYNTQNALDYVQKNILNSKKTKAFVNNVGDTSEGMDTLAWIEKMRSTPEGKERSYLFLHPKFRVPYLWMPNAKEPLPYKNQKLPQDCICIYASSDTRGVDLPIGKGEVHVFLRPTSSLQELMQTLYRARGIGAAHKMIFHISEAWEKQIKPLDPAKGITYGDVVKYIVDRTADNKEPINEAAQLIKISGKLKALISKYLRQPNPKFDQINYWDENNLLDFGNYILLEAPIFKVIRKLYIKKKEIDFEDCYEPLEKIDGTQKLLNEYDHLQEAIQELINELPPDDIEGKTDLREDLAKLADELKQEKEKVNVKEVLDQHERFLPAETPKARLAAKNVKETVKELQLQKIFPPQKKEAPEKAQAADERKHKYFPLNFAGLFENTGDLNDPVALPVPFDNLYISPEAREVLEKYGIRRGDPILYLVQTQKKEEKLRLTLVSKMDYHSVIFPAIREGQIQEKDLHVYALNMHDFSQIDGTGKNQNELPDLFMGAKCFLGFKEYNKEETKKLKAWINSLDGKKPLLLNYLKEKATLSLYEEVDGLIQAKVAEA